MFLQQAVEIQVIQRRSDFRLWLRLWSRLRCGLLLQQRVEIQVVQISNRFGCVLWCGCRLSFGVVLQQAVEIQIVEGRLRRSSFAGLDRGDIRRCFQLQPVQIVEAQVKGAVQLVIEGQVGFRLRLIRQQPLNELFVQRRCRDRTGSSQCDHGRILALEAVDGSEVLRVGLQLPLLADKRVAVTLTGIDVHQFQAQIATLRRLLYGGFQQVGGVVQAAVGDALIDFCQQWIDRWLGDRRHTRLADLLGGSRRGGGGCNHGGGQLDGRRSHVQAFEAARWQFQVGTEFGFFGQRARHAQVLFRFLLGLALARQQQQKQQQRQQCGAGNQRQQQRVAENAVQAAIVVFRRDFAGGRVSRRGIDRGGCRCDHRFCRGRLQLGVDDRRGRDRRFCRSRSRRWHRNATLGFEAGQLVVFQFDQPLQFVQLALQIGHAAFQFVAFAAAGVEVFLGRRQFVAQRLVTGSTLACGSDQLEVVLLGNTRRRGLRRVAPGGIQLPRLRPETTALTPGGVLFVDFFYRLALRNVLDLLLVRHTQDLASLELVDVAVDEGIRVERLDRQHGLVHRATLTRARGNFPQGVAAHGGVVARRADRRGHAGGLGGFRGKLGGVDQYAVVAQQAALGPQHLDQEFDHRLWQRLAGGHFQDTLARRVDHRGEGQVIEEGLACDAGLAEFFCRRQARLDLGGSEVTYIEQFDLGVQRLVLRRLEGQFAQPEGMRHTGRQRRRCGYC